MSVSFIYRYLSDQVTIIGGVHGVLLLRITFDWKVNRVQWTQFEMCRYCTNASYYIHTVSIHIAILKHLVQSYQIIWRDWFMLISNLFAKTNNYNFIFNVNLCSVIYNCLLTQLFVICYITKVNAHIVNNFWWLRILASYLKSILILFKVHQTQIGL